MSPDVASAPIGRGKAAGVHGTDHSENRMNCACGTASVVVVDDEVVVVGDVVDEDEVVDCGLSVVEATEARVVDDRDGDDVVVFDDVVESDLCASSATVDTVEPGVDDGDASTVSPSLSESVHAATMRQANATTAQLARMIPPVTP